MYRYIYRCKSCPNLTCPELTYPTWPVLHGPVLTWLLQTWLIPTYLVQTLPLPTWPVKNWQVHNSFVSKVSCAPWVSLMLVHIYPLVHVPWAPLWLIHMPFDACSMGPLVIVSLVFLRYVQWYCNVGGLWETIEWKLINWHMGGL